MTMKLSRHLFHALQAQNGRRRTTVAVTSNPEYAEAWPKPQAAAHSRWWAGTKYSYKYLLYQMVK